MGDLPLANLNTEGFDWFPSGKTVAERQDLWAANRYFNPDSAGGMQSTPDVITGRFGFGKAFSIVNSQNPSQWQANGYCVPVYDELEEGFVGFSFFRAKVGNTSFTHPGIGFYDAITGAMQLYIEFGEVGVIRVWRGWPTSWDGPVSIGTSSAGAFEEGVWFNVEVYAKIGNTGGEVQVRINTVIKVDIVAADTQNTALAQFDSVFLGAAQVGAFLTNGASFAIDDFFINDTTGATCNTWLGNLRVKSQWMTADGANIDFTIGGTSPAATNWQSILNNNLTDAQYVFSATPGEYDLYVPDPNLNAPFVRVLQVRAALRQDDATQRSAKMLLRIGSTLYEDDVEHFTNQNYTMYFGRWELNPDTGVSFTGAEVNALQAGVKVES
jgi:hypothetical protein